MVRCIHYRYFLLIIVLALTIFLTIFLVQTGNTTGILNARLASTISNYLPIVFKPSSPTPQKLIWPIGCVPGQSCDGNLGYPDIDGDGNAFNCGQPGYEGHQGTDIGISWSQMDQGTPVYAAADGQVLWVFDGKYDRCPSSNPDCHYPGYQVCTEIGPYCGTGTCCCYWCFNGGNVVVIRHYNSYKVFATRYDHLRAYSILVKPGDYVQQGQKIAEVGSAGNSGGPHLHFEVWGTGFYQLSDPWAGPCGPNYDDSLWRDSPPWGGNEAVPAYPPGHPLKRYELSPDEVVEPNPVTPSR